MIKEIILISYAFAASLMCSAQTITFKQDNVSWKYAAHSLANFPFIDGKISADDHLYNPAALTSIVVADESNTEENVVEIDFADGHPSIVAPGSLADVLTITTAGASVDITSLTTDREITYRLKGQGENFTLHGDYKCVVSLDGVNLTGAAALPAVWIDNGKRIEFNVASGTRNTFSDQPTNEKKSAFFVKGHAEWKGDGSVSIARANRHAYSSNEYTQFKASFTGNFSVAGAGSDGLHIEQYLEINGGTIEIADTKGDCIDVACRYEDDGTTPTADENNGQIIVRGGTITVSATADDTKGVKCEKSMTFEAGRINATATGDGSRGVQVGEDLIFGTADATDPTAAYIYLTASGDSYTDPASGETNKCRGLKVKRDLYHYVGTIERNTESTLGKKKILDVDGEYKVLSGAKSVLKEITVE